MEQEVYNEAKACLGHHITLNETVPAEVGCAEAVSYILTRVGIPDGNKGIAGTPELYDWLLSSSHFTRIAVPEAGAIVISPTGMGNGLIEGHTGIFGQFGIAFPGDWGIMSNDSASGKFLEYWSWVRWQAYYGKAGKLPLAIFRAV